VRSAGLQKPVCREFTVLRATAVDGGNWRTDLAVPSRERVIPFLDHTQDFNQAARRSPRVPDRLATLLDIGPRPAIRPARNCTNPGANISGRLVRAAIPDPRNVSRQRGHQHRGDETAKKIEARRARRARLRHQFTISTKSSQEVSIKINAFRKASISSEHRRWMRTWDESVKSP